MGVLDIIFPVKCLECGRGGKYICNNCLQKVRPICSFNPGSSIFSIFRYEGVVRKGIIALKYKFAFDVARELSDICIQKLNTSSFAKNKRTMVPVPLHRKRTNWRGFNQSELVGKLIAQKMNWKFYPNILVRSLASKPQVGLPRSERVRNISGKFAVNPSLREKIRGQDFLLFDDVATTGATLNEALKVLQEEGAGKIICLTIAK